MRRGAEGLDIKTWSGEAWMVRERAVMGMEAAVICLWAEEAVGVLAISSGGSSVYSDVPVRRFWRDVQAINLNGIVRPNTDAEIYGRILCGLEPATNVM